MKALRSNVAPELFWRMAFVEVLLCIEANDLREEMEWIRTSHLLSLIHNTNSSKENRSTPADYNPYSIRRKKNAPPAEIDETKARLLSQMQKIMNHGK